MFISESKSISTRTIQREFKGLELNSCVALRKPLISEANRRKGFNLWGWLDSGAMEEVLVRSFSNVMSPKNEVTQLPEYTEWPDYSICGFFLPWWHRHIPRWQCPYSSGSNCERVVQGAWDIIFTHGSATTESRPEPRWDSLGCAGEDFAQWSDSPIINTRSWWKMNKKLDGNKCCDIIEAYRNDATANTAVIRAKGGKTKYYSVTFFWTGSVFYVLNGFGL